MYTTTRRNEKNMAAATMTEEVPRQLQWIETLDLYGPTHTEGLKVEQGAELEKAMHDAALASVKEGYRRLSQLQVPASRRLDYYAEMLKTDKQMAKIRKFLVEAQQRIEAVEGRKKRQAQKKFSKQLKAAKIEKKKADIVEKKNAKPMLKSSDRKEMAGGPEPRHKSSKGKGKGKGKGGAKKAFGSKGRSTKPAFGSKGKGQGKGKSFSKTNGKSKISKSGPRKAGKFGKRK